MTRQSAGSAPDHINMIGEGTVLDGTITSSGDIHVRGKIVGTVRAEGKVVIAQEGEVEGEVASANADIAGRVDGDVRVEGRLILKTTARIEGNIYTDRLVIEEGAVYNGSCEMGRSMPGRSESKRPVPAASQSEEA